MGVAEIEGTLEAEPVDDGGGAGGEIHFGVNLDLAVHEGLVGFDGELQHVLNMAGIDGEVEADVAALDASDVDDLALGNDVRVEEPRIDGLEVGVAVGAVNDGVEAGVEGHGTLGDVEAEVRGGGGAVDDDFVELALVAAVGGEDAADAFDGAEVGVAEGVAAVDGGGARVVRVEGAEVAGGIDVAGGARIDEDGVEAHGLAGGDGAELDLADEEVEGELAGLAVFDDEVGAVDVDFVDEDFDFAIARVDAGLRGLVHLRHVGALIFGREMDVEAGDLDVVDDDGRVEELMPVEDAEGEAVDGNHGVVAVEVVGVELEACAGDLEAADKSGVELVELDAAVEAGAEGFNDFGFEHGAGAMEIDVAGDEGGDGEDEEDGGGPEKGDGEGMMTAAALDGRGYGFVDVRAQNDRLF